LFLEPSALIAEPVKVFSSKTIRTTLSRRKWTDQGSIDANILKIFSNLEFQLAYQRRGIPGFHDSGDVGSDFNASMKKQTSSGGATFVAMMQTTDFRERNNLAYRGRLYAASLRTILV
jgi:hypothetical protein